MNLAQLIIGCKKGDAQSQKILFECYSKRLLLLCIRYVQNSHDAEELMLNGFLKIFSSIRDFEYIDEIRCIAWLKKVVVNECLMFLRRDKNIKFIDEECLGDMALNEDTIASLNSKDILGLISTLPDGYRIVFNLFVIEGFSHKEIALMLDITESTSKSQLMRARLNLQKSLKRQNLVYATK